MSLPVQTGNLIHTARKPMHRREFFKKLCALSASMAFPVACSQSGDSASTEGTHPDTVIPINGNPALSRQAFEDTIDTVFSVTHQNFGIVDLQLKIVADEFFIPEADQFSISLTGPDSPVLPEDIYSVYNDNLGDFNLYIQPGDANNGQQFYVAVFSLLGS